MEKQLESYFDRLFPLNRSLTGDGVRETFNILNEIIDFKVKEVPSGTKAHDWLVPKEWNVEDAYIITPNGKKIADFRKNNLHLMGYSIPCQKTLTWEELKPHLYTLPQQPKAIPYITSYYKERWGFCLTQEEYDRLPQKGNYKVVINSSLKEGSMTIGEAVLEGSSKKEIFFTSYCCHPSMANNELSGMLALAFLYQELKKRPNRKYTYRFYLAPETIGAIYNLSLKGNYFKENMLGGIVLTCCGDAGDITLKKSRTPSYFDEIFYDLLQKRTKPFKVREFSPTGSDERQYCSPGYNLPLISLSRTIHGEYPEYHTSLDNKNLMNFHALKDYIELIIDAVDKVEADQFYMNTNPYCEPQLGKRNLYPTLSFVNQNRDALKILLYLLNYSDGQHSIFQIAQKLGIEEQEVMKQITPLVEKKLLKLIN